MIDPATASAEIDLGALTHNLDYFRSMIGSSQLMLAVKADAYGHGLIRCAAAARAAGVDWLGVATPEEALALRAAGDAGRLLFWLYGPDTDLTPLVAVDVDAAAHTREQIDRLVTAARGCGRAARVHLKVDTGMSRNGATAADWPELCRVAADAERAGAIRVVGIWTHLASADEFGAPSVPVQLDAFAAAQEIAAGAGLQPELRHVANSAAAMLLPQTHLDLVRIGIAAYGIDPGDGVIAAVGAPLRQVMRLRARLVHVKDVDAGVGVSYGLTWHADRRTRLGLVPLGYADGIPRSGGNRAEIGADGVRLPIRGRVCMDQFVVELTGLPGARIGDEVVIFGPGDDGEPTVADWAGWAGTIGHEIVTGIGTRVPRVFQEPGSAPEDPPLMARGRNAESLGLVASIAALAAGGVALGMELERRVVSKRLRPEEPDTEPFFSLRSDGPPVTTPDGVALHCEVDEREVDEREVDEREVAATGADRDRDVTLVLVHGYALSLDCWHFQRKHFRGKVRQVLYDQRSHGRSGRSAPELCRIGVLAEDLRQVLDEVAGPPEVSGPLVLAGHSMGGMTIMHLALVHPELFGERIRGVALFATAAGEMANYSPIRGLPGRAFSRLVQPTVAALNRLPEAVQQTRSAGSDLSFVVTKRGSFGSDVPASYVQFMSDMLAQTPLEVLADFYPAFAELDEYAAFDVLRRVETAVIGGEDDAVTPVRHTDQIIEALPDADVRRLADCGHMGIIEHAGAFNEVLDKLLDRVRARSEPPGPGEAT